jgi:uncharacterized protein (TIGR04255 family)
MDDIVAALDAAYSPPYVTRTGLRYRDFIDIADLGVREVPLPKLVNPTLAAEFSLEFMRPRVKESYHRIVMAIGDPGPLLALQYGWLVGPKSSEPCFMVDSDFYEEQQMALLDALTRLDDWNREAGRMFRWVVQDALRDALRPELLKEGVSA